MPNETMEDFYYSNFRGSAKDETAGREHSEALSNERNELLQTFFAYQQDDLPAAAGATTGARRGGLQTPSRKARAKKQPADGDESWEAFFHYQGEASHVGERSRPNTGLQPSPAAGRRGPQPKQLEEFYRYGEASTSPARGNRSTPSRSTGSIGLKLHERGEKWRERVQQNTERLKDDLHKTKEQEHTFKPKINRNYRAGSRDRSQTYSQGRDAGNENVSSEDGAYFGSTDMLGDIHEPHYVMEEVDVGTRLHNVHLNTLVKKSEAKKNREEEAARKLSFQPKVVRAAWTEEVEPRYLGMTERTPSAMVSEMIEREEREVTFTPVTNRRVPPYVSRYLQTPVHKRLCQTPRKKTAEYADEAEEVAQTFQYGDQTLEGFYGEGKQVEGQKPSSGRRLTATEQDGFAKRQALWTERAKAKKERLATEGRSATPFKPSISRASSKIAANPSTKRKPLTQPLDAHRSASAAEPEWSFAPSIDARSEKLAPQWKKHEAGVKARRTKEQETYRQEQERAEMSNLSFQPQISPSASKTKGYLKKAVSSRENYAQFLHMNRAKKEAELRPLRQELVEQESAPCTFVPEVHGAPDYVKEIAYQMALAREAQQHSRSSGDSFTPPRSLDFSTDVSAHPYCYQRR